MKLVASTHADSEFASQAAKKYIRIGASPRAGQAIISAAKVLALIKGRFNVAYSDINQLAYPVFRHRIKLNFEAIANGVTADKVIEMLLDEMNKRPKAESINSTHSEDNSFADENENSTAAEETKPRKKGFFKK